MANFPLVNSICAKDRSSHPHLLPPSEPVGYETRSTSLVDGDFGTLAVSTRPCQLASWIFSINNITLVANISKVSWLSCKQQTSKPHTCTMLYIGPRHLGHLRGAALGSWQPVPAACRPIPTAFICFTGGEGRKKKRWRDVRSPTFMKCCPFCFTNDIPRKPPECFGRLWISDT